MRQATCLILSFLIFATPLFAIKEGVYNAQGVKIGYFEDEYNQKIFYDLYGNRQGQPTFDYYYEKELKRLQRNREQQDRYDKAEKEGEELGEEVYAAVFENNPELTLWVFNWMFIILGISLLHSCIAGEFDNAICSPK